MDKKDLTLEDDVEKFFINLKSKFHLGKIKVRFMFLRLPDGNEIRIESETGLTEEDIWKLVIRNR